MVAIRRYDNDGPRQLGLLATQVSLSLVLSTLARIVDHLPAVLSELHKMHGFRLRGLREKMGFDPESGKLYWQAV